MQTLSACSADTSSRAMTTLPLVASALLGLLLLATGGGRTGRRPRVVALVASLVALRSRSSRGACCIPSCRAPTEVMAFSSRSALRSYAPSGSRFFLASTGRACCCRRVRDGCAMRRSRTWRRSGRIRPCSSLATCCWSEPHSVHWWHSTVRSSSAALLGPSLQPFFVGLYDPKGGSRTASRMLVLCGVGLVFLAVALGALHAIQSRTFLVDGSPITHAWAFPELARIDYVGTQQLLLSPSRQERLRSSVRRPRALCRALSVSRLARPRAARCAASGVDDGVRGVHACRDAWPPAPRRRFARGHSLGSTDAMRARRSGRTVWRSCCSRRSYLASTATFGLVSLSRCPRRCRLTHAAGILGAIGGTATSGCAAAAAIIALGAVRERIGTVDVREIRRGLAIEAPLLACSLGIAALGVGGARVSQFSATCLVGLGAVVRYSGDRDGSARRRCAARGLAKPAVDSCR